MRIVRVAALAAAAAAALSTGASANHAWADYHWQKGSGALTVKVGDNVTGAWDAHLVEAMNGGSYTSGASGQGWNATPEIESPIVAGSTNAKNCRAVAGTIQVCNSKYGNTGWLGIASIWLSGGHISQGTTKLNDTYYNTAQYNTPAWRRLVMCQEIGHDYGLGHTNEIFDNYNDGTCMDYTNAPSGGTLNGFNYGPSNEYINQHDKDMLASIYGHLHQSQTNFGERTVGKAPASSNAGGFSAAESEPGLGPAQWGRAIHHDAKGRPDLFELDLGNGKKKITHVFWTLEAKPHGKPHHDDHEH